MLIHFGKPMFVSTEDIELYAVVSIQGLQTRKHMI